MLLQGMEGPQAVKMAKEAACEATAIRRSGHPEALQVMEIWAVRTDQGRCGPPASRGACSSSSNMLEQHQRARGPL